MTRKCVAKVFNKSKKYRLQSKLPASTTSPVKDGSYDISVTSIHEKSGKMMKKFSKKRTILAIPGFRKHKKSSHFDKNAPQIGPLIVEDEVLDFVTPTTLLTTSYLDSKGSNSGDDSSSIRSSVSSLEAVLVDNKRTVSIDSGIDCQVSTSSLVSNNGLTDNDMIKGVSQPTKSKKSVGRAPIASPEDDSLLEDPKLNSTSDLNLDSTSVSKGGDCDSQNVHNNSSVSFGTLSDCSSCSCDSCDSASDSDCDLDTGSASKQNNSTSDTDSDSEYHSQRCHRRSRRHSSDSDSSQCSDSFDDPKCYFTSSRNSFLNSSVRSNSFVNKPSNNSVNTSTTVNSAKSKKLVKKASKSDKKSNKSDKKSSSSKLGRISSTSSFMKKLTGKLDKSSSKKQHNSSKLSLNSSKVSLNSSHVCVSPQPVKYPYSHRVTSTPKHVPSSSSSQLHSNKDSAFVSCKSSNQNSSVNSSIFNTSQVIRRQRISYTDSDISFSKISSKPMDRKNVVSFSEDLLEKDGLIYKPIEHRPVSVIANGNSKVKHVKLNRSASDVSNVRKPSIRTVPGMKSKSGQSDHQCSDSFLNSSSNMDSLVHNIDTSKSPAEVKQAMQKTAFWIENNGYDSNPDEVSTKSLLKQNRDVNEKELCDKIIGIYFSEESDSSLSSSCLDNSGDSSSSLSLSEEENISPSVTDPNSELTVATFIPAPYQTLKATTRKIKSPETEDSLPENSKLLELHQKKIQLEQLKQQESILKEKIYNLANDQTKAKAKPVVPEKRPKESSAHLCCDSRPTSQLSEQEVDTITKLHTICNGQRVVRYLNQSESQMIIKHFPPPKSASRIIWDERLENADEVHHTPIKEQVKPRSILSQRSQNETFPYEDDKPSPIVITRIRRSKSGRRGRDWPW